MKSEDARDLFGSVSSQRMSTTIIEQIKELIRSKRLSPGDRLPSERELCELVGASRVTVREALRVLEANGLIAIRVGAGGGAFVTKPSSDRLGAGLAELLNLAPVTGAQVTEARLIFELGIIPTVVERATDDDIEELRLMVQQHSAALKRGEYTMALSAAFHTRVGACTHNPAIEMLVSSFHGPLLSSLREAKIAAPLMGERGVSEHRQFVSALAVRDTEKAVEIMRRHIRRTARRLSAETETENSTS